MPKEEWGVKRLCPTTGKRFYDLNKSPIVSPYTGDVVELDTGRKSTVALARSKTEEKPKPKSKEADVADEVLEDDDTSDVDLGDDVLDDDDDEDTVALDDLADVASDDADDS